MYKYLKCSAIFIFIFALYGCDPVSDSAVKNQPQIQSAPKVEVDIEPTEALNNAGDAEEKDPAVIMANFEEKLKASTQDMSEEDKTAAMELLEEFQQKLEEQKSAPVAP